MRPRRDDGREWAREKLLIGDEPTRIESLRLVAAA